MPERVTGSFSLIDVLLSVSPLTEIGGATMLTDAVAVVAVDPPASNGVVLVNATSGGGGGVAAGFEKSVAVTVMAAGEPPGMSEAKVCEVENVVAPAGRFNVVGAVPSPQVKTSVIGLNAASATVPETTSGVPTATFAGSGIQGKRQGDPGDRERLGRALDPAVAVIHRQGDDVRAVICIGVGRGLSGAGGAVAEIPRVGERVRVGAGRAGARRT